jgi:hypothetical protein
MGVRDEHRVERPNLLDLLGEMTSHVDQDSGTSVDDDRALPPSGAPFARRSAARPGP